VPGAVRAQIGQRTLKFLDCSGNERAGHLVKAWKVGVFFSDCSRDETSNAGQALIVARCFILFLRESLTLW
jgi:hypothetical protein